MKQKLFDTNTKVSHGGRVEDYWMVRVMHPKFANEEAKSNNEVDMVAILKAYKVKGFEFGNWVNQNDRYDFVHAFVRSAQLLSEVVGSKNLGLDLLVGVAFGARGRGGGAAAHYEPHHNMINLTRDNSYGCLAHEWAHAIDYNLGRHVDQNKDYAYLTGGHSVAAILPTNTGAQLRMWANAVVDEAKATGSYKRIAKADEYWHRRTEVWARFFEQYVAYQCKLKKKSPRFLSMTFEEYAREPQYWTQEDFVKIARGSMFSFIATLKGVLNDRYTLSACPYKYKTREMLYPKPGKQIKPKYKTPLYIKLKQYKQATYTNMLCMEKAEIKDGVVYYIGRDVDATPKQMYRRIPEDKLIQDYDRVPNATAERVKRAKLTPTQAKAAAAKSKTKTVTTSTSKKKESSGAKAPKVKPLENFVLTKTGKLCTDQKAVSDWASKNIVTWKRVYVVRHYVADKETRVHTVFVIKLKNGQYYTNDFIGLTHELNREHRRWNLFIHPKGEKEKMDGTISGMALAYYSFRDLNEAVWFAQKIGGKFFRENKEDSSAMFHNTLKSIYEDEYEYAQFPNRRGKPYAAINWYEKPQPVKTITKK